MRTSRLSAISVPVLLLAGSALASDGPLAWWKFDEAPGAAVASDSAGSFNGTVTSATFGPGGISGNAISLGGTGSLVDMGNVLSLTGTAFSMQTWIRTTATTGASTVVAGKHDTGYFNGYMMRMNRDSAGYGATGKGSFYQSNSVGATAVGTSTITDNQWHHLLATYTPGGQLRLYVDGVLESAIGAAPINGNGVSFLIGGATSSGVKSNFYRGDVDEVQVYGYELSSDQVKYLYANPGKAIPAPGMAGLMLAGMATMGRRRSR